MRCARVVRMPIWRVMALATKTWHVPKFAVVAVSRVPCWSMIILPFVVELLHTEPSKLSLIKFGGVCSHATRMDEGDAWLECLWMDEEERGETLERQLSTPFLVIHSEKRNFALWKILWMFSIALFKMMSSLYFQLLHVKNISLVLTRLSILNFSNVVKKLRWLKLHCPNRWLIDFSRTLQRAQVERKGISLG